MNTPRKRILVQRPGSYDVLRFDDTLIEAPNTGEVQIDVKACGINFADICVRLGLYGAAKGEYPICPGLEFAGTVKAVGESVTEFKPVDRVFGATRFGGYATAINCPTEHLWPLPDTWDFAKGATFPVAYLTAYYALHHVGQLQPQNSVLVHSAAGGVGTALLHLLKKNGSRSVGVVGRTEKVPAAEAAGAAFVIDKSREGLWKKAAEISPEGYDIILDANGASTLRASYHHLKPAGRLLVYGFSSMFSHSGRKNPFKLLWYYLRTPRFSPFDLTSLNRTISGFNLIYLFDRVTLFRQIMKALMDWERAEDIPRMPITTFSFKDVANAHMRLESGRSVGKLALLT